MTGDFSRLTFDRRRHYSGVRMQQGRVQLDADWNEAVDIGLNRDRTTAADLVGPAGGPLDAGFAIAVDGAGTGLTISPGRYYVDGILCENEAAVAFDAQPDRVGVAALTGTGTWIVYLDVWERHLSYLDDPAIRESALGGPDTATRTRTVWQVRALKVAGGTTCLDAPADWTAATTPPDGALRARATPPQTGDNPCLVAADARYQGLENQLYRVEVRRPGPTRALADATVGERQVTAAIVPVIESSRVVAHRITMSSSGGWTAGDFVEVVRKAGGAPMDGTICRVLSATGAELVVVGDLASVRFEHQPVVRPVTALFAWSRDNGSVTVGAAPPTLALPEEVPVDDLGPDDVRGLAMDDWVELSDDSHELEGLSGHLAKVVGIARDSRTVTLSPAPPPGFVVAGRRPRLRRWDGLGSVKGGPVNQTAQGYIPLESGVEVRFEAGRHALGDHWTIPARTATADARSGRIEWPADPADATLPAALPRHGTAHHFARLAVVVRGAAADPLLVGPDGDCRRLFPPLTRLTTLVYLGGDGQEAFPTEILPQPLRVAVLRGGVPVAGARVRFTADRPAAVLSLNRNAPLATWARVLEARTPANGELAVHWRLDQDRAAGAQAVIAVLLDAAGAPIGAPIVFSGNHSIAEDVRYFPPDEVACADLAATTTVQEALDVLCRRTRGGDCCEVVEPGDGLAAHINELIRGGQASICLHLKPGDHAATGRIDAADHGHVPISVALAGCGPGVRLTGNLNATGLRELSLADLEILVGEGMRLEGCARVAIDRCAFASTLVGGPPVLQIGNAADVRISDSSFEPRPEAWGYTLPALSAGGEIADIFESPEDVAREDLHVLALKLAQSTAARDELVTAIAQGIKPARNLTMPERQAYLALEEVLRSLAGEQETLAPPIEAGLIGLRQAVIRGQAHPVLAIMDGLADTLLRDCDVRGALVVYDNQTFPIHFGDPATAPAGAEPTTDAGVAHVRGLTRAGAGRLVVRGVQLGRVAPGSAVGKALIDPASPPRVLFREIHLANTHLTRGENVLVAYATFMTSDHLSDRADDFAGPFGAAVLSDTFTMTGCRAERVPVRPAGTAPIRVLHRALDVAEAANLRLALTAI